MKPHRWHTPYKSFLFSIFFVALCAQSIQTYAMQWTIVTSEADSGPGTLREAINLVNAGGTAAPNAIAFANTVQTITLQSNLPVITESVLIDGLAIANIASPQNTIEGDCSLLPSPVDDPKLFSANIRVTIDGSGIPNNIDANSRWGLRLLSAQLTTRGIRVKNIVAPAKNSDAFGILSIDAGGRVECCEISHIQNTANTTNSSAVGILGDQSDRISVSKCYVHDVKGGSILDCPEGSASEQLSSGNAYGIRNANVDSNRIECITSGSIHLICDNEDLQAEIGHAFGIYNEPFTVKSGVANCPVPCDEACPNGEICIQNNLVTNIFGGSIITNLTSVSLLEVAGIAFPSSFIAFNEPALVQNNVIKTIHGGSATLQGDNTTSDSLGTFGILADTISDLTVNCNSIDNIKTGSRQVEGENSSAFPGYTHGIFVKSEGQSSLECNAISHICGPTAYANGLCSTIISNNQNNIEARHISGGLSCALSSLPTVAGIALENETLNGLTSTTTLNNNTVKHITGGKYVAQGEQSSVSAVGTAGIDVFYRDVSASQNKVDSVIGTELVAVAGSLSAIKREGSSGICLTAPIIEATENQVTLIREGTIKSAARSFGANITPIFFGLLKNNSTLTKQLNEDTAFPYAPVITSGIVLSFPDIGSPGRNCTASTPWCITNNSVNTVTGSTVQEGTQPIGSLAAGIWIQPIFSQSADTRRSFESCAAAQQANVAAGIASNNTVHDITSGMNIPAYGIFLDGSAQFFSSNVAFDEQESLFFTLDNNTVSSVKGAKELPVFDINLLAVSSSCPGTGSEQFERIAFPFLPFEPTSGIYSIFGGCSTLSNNVIKAVSSADTNARGITTAASSDMNIFNNTISDIKGYGIFVGGAVVDNELLPGSETQPQLEDLASLRNKVYSNSTVNNAGKGIYLGLIDWNNALFGIESLNVCPGILRSPACSDITPENSTSICGNHGQESPCITTVICNSNGTVTIDATLKNSLPLTRFIIQFFRNSSYDVPHGEEHISDFDDSQFVFQTDFNGNAKERFTFVPLAELKSNDIVSAHVTVAEDILSPVGNEFFGDTSEFSNKNQQPVCPLSGFKPKPSKPSKPSGFAELLYRAPGQKNA